MSVLTVRRPEDHRVEGAAAVDGSFVVTGNEVCCRPVVPLSPSPRPHNWQTLWGVQSLNTSGISNLDASPAATPQRPPPPLDALSTSLDRGSRRVPRRSLSSPTIAAESAGLLAKRPSPEQASGPAATSTTAVGSTEHEPVTYAADISRGGAGLPSDEFLASLLDSALRPVHRILQILVTCINGGGGEGESTRLSMTDLIPWFQLQKSMVCTSEG